MNVSLTPELENLVQEKVKSGNYNSASEVIREALRLLKEQDQLREIRREEIRREVMKGVEQIRSGEFTTISNQEEAEQMIEKIKREGRQRLAERK
jgi:antitoxin ParD1/3/4